METNKKMIQKNKYYIIIIQKQKTKTNQNKTKNPITNTI